MSKNRNSELTRKRLLQAGFGEFHRNGYQGADLDQVLADAGVTKGALYYHFGSKRGLAYSVVEETLRNWILDRWLRPLASAPDPLAALVELAQWGERSATPVGLSLGCPLLGLSQELAGTDEGFQLRLAAIYEEWRAGLARYLVKAQLEGFVRMEVRPAESATFIVAAWQGSIGLAKVQRDEQTLTACRRGLEAYLETLRPDPSGETSSVR